jgi:hypothetical protein
VSARAALFSPFRPEEFRLYEPQNRGDESLNEKRLAVRRKLQAIGEATRVALLADGLSLERRESLHHPFSVNHHRVVAQWTSLIRDAKARRAFARAVGPDLGKDVDPGHANVALMVAIDDLGLELGLRIGAEAWYDAQNLVNRCRDGAGRAALLERLRAAPGFELRIHDWETRFPTDRAGPGAIDDLLRWFQPGKHRLSCTRAVSKSDPLATDAAFLGVAVDGLKALAPLYRFAAWGPENDALLRQGGAGFAPVRS